MPLSWNEIRHRVIAFSREWQGENREAAERQSFWNDFFNVFGVRHRTFATFEESVRKLSGDWGFIDLFWRGWLLVEHKSAGETSLLPNRSSCFARYSETIQPQAFRDVPLSPTVPPPRR